MPLNNKNIDNLFHLKIKPKYYAKMLRHIGINASPFLLKKVKMLETNAAAHKKQRESLSLNNKVQILNKNADAHKMKRKSLSPEDKDLFVKDNTAAQHKHCKLLSPDQKSQVLKINAAKQKNTKSLSLLNC
jgi:hypothetical protein